MGFTYQSVNRNYQRDRETYPSEAPASKLTFVWKTPEFQPLESGVIYIIALQTVLGCQEFRF